MVSSYASTVASLLWGCSMEETDYYQLRVAAVTQETHDAYSLEFDIPETLDTTFRYRPGQFLTLRVPWQDDWLPRCYSLSSSPFDAGRPRVTIKRVDDGRGSNWICDTIKPGTSLQVLKPAGAFVPRDLGADFILFAGGSGITPVLSILRSALSQGSGLVRLFYANRDEKSVIFRDTLQQLASANPQRLQVIHWLDSVQGHPNAEQLAGFAAGMPDAQVHICGPEPFMKGVEAGMKLAGMPAACVHVERFVSLPGESEAPVANATELAGASATQLTVELDGETHVIECERGEVLLAAMRREGMSPPHSCLVGSCATCMCTLVDGEVDLLANEALDDDELEEGWRLACQAVATTDKVHLKFPD